MRNFVQIWRKYRDTIHDRQQDFNISLQTYTKSSQAGMLAESGPGLAVDGRLSCSAPSRPYKGIDLADIQKYDQC